MRSGTGRTLTLIGIFLAVWLAGRLILPLVFPFLLGAALAAGAEPAVSWLHRRAGIPRPLGSFIGVTGIFCLLALGAALVCALLLRELGLLAAVVPDLGSTVKNAATTAENWLMRIADRVPAGVQPLVREGIRSTLTDGTALVDRGLGYLLDLAGTLLGHIPDSALTLGTAILSGFMISAKYHRLRGWFLRKLPRKQLRPVIETFRRVRRTVVRWLAAQLKLSGVTFSILLAAFLLLRIRYAPLAALAVAMVDAFPVLGTGTVLLPWSLLSLFQGSPARAAGLAGVYVILCVTRSVLEPKLLGKHLGLDPLVTLMALYAGYRLWGIGGMIVSPILAVTAIQLLPPPAEAGK